MLILQLLLPLPTSTGATTHLSGQKPCCGGMGHRHGCFRHPPPSRSGGKKCWGGNPSSPFTHCLNSPLPPAIWNSRRWLVLRIFSFCLLLGFTAPHHHLVLQVVGRGVAAMLAVLGDASLEGGQPGKLHSHQVREGIPRHPKAAWLQRPPG